MTTGRQLLHHLLVFDEFGRVALLVAGEERWFELLSHILDCCLDFVDIMGELEEIFRCRVVDLSDPGV